jgi:TPP-dependent 2-oxoacid decarboxylase
MRSELFSKPCGYGPCMNLIAKAMRCRLTAAVYCTPWCAAHARLEREGANHPLKRRTREQKRQHAVIGGRAGAVTKRKHKLLTAQQQVDRWLTADLREYLDVRQIAKVKVLMARCYLEGHEDGYQGGYTASRRAKKVRRVLTQQTKQGEAA